MISRLPNKKIFDFFFILIFTLSIFFWALEYNTFEIRFIYLILIFFIPIKYYKLDLLIIFFLLHFIYGVYLYPNEIKNFTKYAEITVLVLTYITIKYYYESILFNINKFIYLFSIFFFILLVYVHIYKIADQKNIYQCIIGCFSYFRFIFNENSHVALFLPAIITYFVVQIFEKFSFFKLFIIIFFHLIIFFNISTTATISYCIGFFILISLKLIFKKKIFPQFIKILFVITILLISSILSFSNFMEIKHRIVGINKVNDYLEISEKYNITQNKSTTHNQGKKNTEQKNLQLAINISSEVYLKSFQLFLLSIKNFPFGNGLNNYKLFHEKNINTIYIDKRNSVARNFNKEDGAANFFKLGVEYGLFSLVLIYFFIKFFFSAKINPDLKILILTILLTQIFVRGVGFYNSGFAIFLFLLIIMNKK